LRMYKMNRSFPRGDSKCCLSSKLLLSHLSEKTTSIILFRHLWLVSTAVLQNMGEHERRKSAPSGLASCIDSHTAPETLRLAERAGIAKAHLSWADLATKSFLAGIFISLGAGFDLVLAGGAPELRASNPCLATLIGAFAFPTGFVVIMLTNMELCTSNMFVLAYSTLRRRTTLYDLARNWIVSYVFNMAGCLFYAGVLYWWSGTLDTEAQRSYAVTQAEGRVNVSWGYNVMRGIMCNWLVGLAFFFATQARDNTSKIYGIWIVV
jgi:formate/nitrite transporter FocA (FNT family)